MRIDRIRLKNFAGVAEAEVRFAPTGVTIVHGPNEAGKSTLMQGINVLFDHRDDSRKEEVRNTKPVNKDVGAEVEADVQVGDCGFTYFKRFHKDKETRLTIHSPRAENLVGRDAHERVQQILAGSVDTSLWQALRITQGRNLDMPELHDQPALAQALDRAAGQAKSGEKEEALFAAVHGEYNRYYTDTGREKEDPFGQARKRGSEAAALVADLQAQLNEVEADISRFASLERTVATQRRGLATLEEAHKKAQTEWDAVSQLAAAFERAAGAHQRAAQNVASANSALPQRRDMVDRPALNLLEQHLHPLHLLHGGGDGHVLRLGRGERDRLLLAARPADRAPVHVDQHAGGRLAGLEVAAPVGVGVRQHGGLARAVSRGGFS